MKPYTMPLAERLGLAAQACRAVHLLSCEQTCLEAKEQLARTKAELEERTRDAEKCNEMYEALLESVKEQADVIVERTRELDEIRNKLSRVEEALAVLVDLKTLKDTEGKTPYYESMQPIAWEKARDVLKEKP